MQWTAAVCLLAVIVNSGGGVTKIPSDSGISQFWTDDYKVFDQIYGRTSDKELYGATLPPTISYGVDLSHLRTVAASEKKERYLDNEDPELNDDLEAYGYGNRYNQLAKQSYKQFTKKPTKSPLKFIGVSELKPISQANDPGTYNYLKHLEHFEKQKAEVPVQFTAGGFKPYVSYTNSNPEEADAYKSIQDILEAHEANKGKNTDNEDTDEQLKYLRYGTSKGRSRGKGQKPVPAKAKSRCPSGRCRKRTAPYRVRTRPYLRRIKHKIYY